jgi:hypothetical protein
MTDTATKLALLDALRELVVETPDLRFGQLVTNLAALAGGDGVETIWDAEDDEWLVATRRLLSRYQSRSASAA